MFSGTTLLFCGIGLGAWLCGRRPRPTTLGAVVGRSLGDWIKYLLDKHYVFGRMA